VEEGAQNWLLCGLPHCKPAIAPPSSSSWTFFSFTPLFSIQSFRFMKGISSGCVVIVQILYDQIKLVNNTSVCESAPQGMSSWLNLCNEVFGCNSMKNVGDASMCGWRECRRVHTTGKPFPPGSVLHSNDAQRKQQLVCMRSNPNIVSEQSGELTDPGQKCWVVQDNHKEKPCTTVKRAHF